MRTIDTLSLGLAPGQVGMVLVAALESFIAVTLITGRLIVLGLLAMGGAIIGFFAPLVLFPADLFAGGLTLEAQYILKDVVLVTAAIIIAAKSFAPRLAGKADRSPSRVASPDRRKTPGGGTCATSRP